MKLVWTPRSLRNLVEISDFIAIDNPQAAQRVLDRIVEAVQLLRDQPAAGRTGRIRGTRELYIAGTRYIVAYREEASSVTIVAVIHASRLWPRSLDVG